MALNKTSRLSLVEQVVIQLKSIIESGEWPVGMRIPAEPELVVKLGVSRNTLREAVRALAHEGLLTVKQGDGTYVATQSSLGAALKRRIEQSDILETLDVRHALERQAAFLAATRRTSEDVEAIRSNLLACDATLGANDIKKYIEYDIKLHQSIIEASHNTLLMELYEHMTDALHVSVKSLVKIKSDFELHQKTLRQLVEAIIEKNVHQAVEAVHQHIEKSKEELLYVMEEES